MATYRKIEDIDSFNNLVDNFLDTRDDLKSKVKGKKIISINRSQKKTEEKFKPSRS